MTPEEKKERNRAYQRKWYLANKQKQSEKSKAWARANKDKVAAIQKAFYESNKDGLYTVYYLPEEHYVGQSNNVRSRMRHHKFYDRYIKDVQLLAKFETRKEAKAFEAKLHNMGYHGKNNGI